jgi:spermidine synthase
MLDVSRLSILEFGAGHSTVWWSKRARTVFSIEEDPGWFRFLERKVNSQENVELVLCEDAREYANKPLGRKFDLIIIDGGKRNLCAETALNCLKEGGAILLDDSEGFWGGESDHSHPIIDLYSESGFMRVDFYGYAPGVITPRCTSLFVKEGTQLLKGLPPPRRK